MWRGKLLAMMKTGLFTSLMLIRPSFAWACSVDAINPIGVDLYFFMLIVLMAHTAVNGIKFKKKTEPESKKIYRHRLYWCICLLAVLVVPVGYTVVENAFTQAILQVGGQTFVSLECPPVGYTSWMLLSQLGWIFGIIYLVFFMPGLVYRMASHYFLMKK